MKTQAKPLKTICLSFLFLLFSIITLNAQDLKKTGFYPGIGIGFGFFYPEEVNEFIEDELSGYQLDFGTYDMYMYFHVQGFVTYKIKRFDISGFLEYAIAPKFITLNDAMSRTFSFYRISPGITGNIYFPFGSGRHAFYAGGGAQYHIMSFESFDASDIGFRIQAGISLQFKNINIQPHFAFNIASAEDEVNDGTDRNFNLNYTGGQIGVNLSFHSPVANR